MRKTMVYLEEEQFLRLKRASASSSKKMSEVIREALSQYFKIKKTSRNYFSFVGIAEGPKRGKTSERVKEVLREALQSSS